MGAADSTKQPLPIGPEALLDLIAQTQGTIEMLALVFLDNDDEVIVMDRAQLELLFNGAREMTGLASSVVSGAAELHGRWLKSYNELADQWRDKYKAELEAHLATLRKLQRANHEHLAYLKRSCWFLAAIAGFAILSLVCDFVRWGWLTL